MKRNLMIVLASLSLLTFGIGADLLLTPASAIAASCEHPMAEVIKHNEADGFVFKHLNKDQAAVMDQLVGDAVGQDLTGDDVTIAQQKGNDEGQIIVGFSNHGCFVGAIPMDGQEIEAILGQHV